MLRNSKWCHIYIYIYIQLWVFKWSPIQKNLTLNYFHHFIFTKKRSISTILTIIIIRWSEKRAFLEKKLYFFKKNISISLF